MLTADIVIDIAKKALWLVIKISAPLLMVSLVVGLIISIFQTVTSIQEQTLTFVPKFIAIFVVLMLTGSWMIRTVVDFFVELCSDFGQFIT